MGDDGWPLCGSKISRRRSPASLSMGAWMKGGRSCGCGVGNNQPLKVAGDEDMSRSWNRLVIGDRPTSSGLPVDDDACKVSI